MRTVHHAPEHTDPHVEEVAAPIGVGGVVRGRGCAFGGAKGRVQRITGLELVAEVGRGVRGDDGAGEGRRAVESRLRGGRLFVVAVGAGDGDVEGGEGLASVGGRG